MVSQWLEAHPDITARHWSMPSGVQWARHWPTDHDFDGQLPDAVIVCIRSFEATIASQLARGMVTCRDEAEASILQALMRAFTWSAARGARTYVSVYEQVVAAPHVFDDLFRWLGVEPIAAPHPIVDGNAKWLTQPS